MAEVEVYLIRIELNNLLSQKEWKFGRISMLKAWLVIKNKDEVSGIRWIQIIMHFQVSWCDKNSSPFTLFYPVFVFFAPDSAFHLEPPP